jgi:hypothetical protein
MTRQDREYLNKLSKECFGTSSRWAKILDNGSIEHYEYNHEIVVPHPDGVGFHTKVVKVPKTVLKRYTQNEVIALMIGIIEKRKEQLDKAFSITVTGHNMSPLVNSTPSVQEIGTLNLHK